MSINMNNIVPDPKNWKIQSSKRKIHIEFFSDDEIYRMRDYIENKIKENKRGLITTNDICCCSKQCYGLGRELMKY